MFSLRSSLEPSKLFTAYSTLTGTVFLVQSTVNQLIPHRLQTYIWSKLNIDRLFTKPPEELTIFIREYHGLTRNQVFEAAEIYLPTKINESNNFLEIGKGSMDDNLSVTIEKGEQIVDYFDDICLKWTFSSKENEKTHQTKHFYELRFKKQFKDRVLEGYVPYLLARANEIKEKNRVVNLCTMTSYGDSIELRHPATFDKLAMDPELKQAIKDDLDRFVKRKEFYNKVGKAWKRGYLLYGPPGTGKSSLIAAIANYLKFDIYDLELTSVYSNSRFRDLLLSTSNRSIIVIEDIDCTREVQKRNTTRTNNRAPADEDDAADEDEAGDEDEDSSEDDYNYPSSTGFTLSGMLNFIDGLWSSCGDERIIIFTTNHKDRLDPALLRPGRMDMHIHMSYCTPAGFRILVSNYLDIHDGNHPVCGQIEDLITKVEVTPAEIAEQLMKTEDPDHALSGLLDFLQSKIQLKDNGVNKVDLPQA